MNGLISVSLFLFSIATTISQHAGAADLSRGLEFRVDFRSSSTVPSLADLSLGSRWNCEGVVLYLGGDDPETRPTGRAFKNTLVFGQQGDAIVATFLYSKAEYAETVLHEKQDGWIGTSMVGKQELQRTIRIGEDRDLLIETAKERGVFDSEQPLAPIYSQEREDKQIFGNTLSFFFVANYMKCAVQDMTDTKIAQDLVPSQGIGMNSSTAKPFVTDAPKRGENRKDELLGIKTWMSQQANELKEVVCSATRRTPAREYCLSSYHKARELYVDATKRDVSAIFISERFWRKTLDVCSLVSSDSLNGLYGIEGKACGFARQMSIEFSVTPYDLMH